MPGFGFLRGLSFDEASQASNPSGRSSLKTNRRIASYSAMGIWPRSTSGWFVAMIRSHPLDFTAPKSLWIPSLKRKSAAVRGEQATPPRITTSLMTPSRSKKTAGRLGLPASQFSMSAMPCAEPIS